MSRPYALKVAAPVGELKVAAPVGKIHLELWVKTVKAHKIRTFLGPSHHFKYFTSPKEWMNVT